MGNWVDIIITSLISPIFFEVLKYFVIFLKNKIKDSSLPYTMTGYWYAYHEAEQNGENYSAYELIKIKQENSRLTLVLYQLTNDKRFYTYKGCGYVRGSKVALAYEEINRVISSNTGTLTLLKRDVSQHTPCFKGIYTEFIKEELNCTSRPYTLYFITVGSWDKLLLTAFKSKYAKTYLEKEKFKGNI